MKGPHVNGGSSVLYVVLDISWPVLRLPKHTNAPPQLWFRAPKAPEQRRQMSARSQNLWNLFKINKLLTCDCKTGFLAQDGAVFVLSEALIKPFVWFVSSSALDLGNVKGAVGEQVDAVVLCHCRSVLEPSDIDGRLSLGVTVQNDGLSPHHDDITGLLDEK